MHLLRILLVLSLFSCTNGSIQFDSGGGDDEGGSFVGAINGPVYSIERDPTGGIVIGGAFTEVSGVTANRIARIDDSGLDTTYASNVGTGFNDVVRKVYYGTSFELAVGGDFTEFNGVEASRLVRLDSDGVKDGTFDIGTGFNLPVYDICEANASNLYVVGGAFTKFNSESNPFLVLLDRSNGSLSNDADPPPNAAVRAVRDIAASLTIAVAGDFTSPETRFGFRSYGGLANGTPAGLNGPGYALVENGFNTYIVGDFTHYGLVPSKGIVEVDLLGNAVTAYAGFNGPAYAIDYTGSSYVVGGDFTGYDPGGGFQPHNRIVNIVSGGGLALGWFSGTGFDGPVYAVKFDTAINKLYVGGAFNHYNGTPVSTVVRLDLNGTLDSTFLPPS